MSTSHTLRVAIEAAITAIKAARALRLHTYQAQVNRATSTNHLLEMMEIGSAINEMESGLRILQALDTDTIEGATPAAGKTFTASDKWQPVPEERIVGVMYGGGGGGSAPIKPPMVYGYYEGNPVTVPDGWELVPLGETVPRMHLKLKRVDNEGVSLEWKPDQVIARDLYPAKIYTSISGKVATIAFAREVNCEHTVRWAKPGSPNKH